MELNMRRNGQTVPRNKNICFWGI